jgi:phosphoglycerate kinase
MKFKKITNLTLKNKTVFIRTDMNVPIEKGHISDDTRIRASLKTIEYAIKNGANVIVATHLGRPVEGSNDTNESVLPIAALLGELLHQNIKVVAGVPDKIDFGTSNIVMLENVRLNVGEKKNDPILGKKYANLCDIFVHDAFATAHRSEASTDAIGYAASEVCAGMLMSSELDALNMAAAHPKAPVVAIVAGSKVSTKLSILENLADKVDYLIVGGGILNTFLLAKGFHIGKSLVEAELTNKANDIMQKMAARGASVALPEDVVTAKHFSRDEIAIQKNINDVKDDDMILDIGTKFANQLADIINKAGTIIWNGPVGVFEFDQFANGTKILANAIATSNAFSLAGGGDTIAAINKFNLMDKISYVSTAGGALLEYLEGKKLPAIKLFEDRA